MTEHLEFPNRSPGEQGGGDGGDGFDKRLRAVEQGLVGISRDLVNIKENMATGSDIEKLRTEIANRRADTVTKIMFGLFGAVISAGLGAIVIFARELIRHFATN